MKIKEGFVLRKMPGVNLVMPIGENAKTYTQSIMLNDTGAFIFEKLSKGDSMDEIAKALTEKYDVDDDKVIESVDRICTNLAKIGVAE